MCFGPALTRYSEDELIMLQDPIRDDGKLCWCWCWTHVKRSLNSCWEMKKGMMGGKSKETMTLWLVANN